MFLKSILPFLILRRSNCHRSSITRISRDVYSRLYPNFLVLPDGSTIRIRYPEPRHLVKLPVDIGSLSDKERKTRLLRRSAAQKEKMEITLDTAYDPTAYLNDRKT